MKTKYLSIIFLILQFLSFNAYTVPSSTNGIMVSEAIVDATTGEMLFDFSLNSNFIYYGFSNNVFLSCTVPFSITTGLNYNNFVINDQLLGCPYVSGIGGGFGVYSTSLHIILPALIEYSVEVRQFSRATPEAPISITIENMGDFYVNPLEVFEVEATVLDEYGNILYTGPKVIASHIGPAPIDPNGPSGELYSFILDGVPADVVSANVYRFLQFQFFAVYNGQINRTVVTSPFRLTHEFSTNICSELLLMGSASFATPTEVQSSFGCPSIYTPPTSCKEDTNDGIAAARVYQKASRILGRKCNDTIIGEECALLLQHQQTALNILVEIQNQVDISCQ